MGRVALSSHTLVISLMQILGSFPKHSPTTYIDYRRIILIISTQTRNEDLKESGNSVDVLRNLCKATQLLTESRTRT